MGFLAGGVPAATGGYNIGFYAGGRTADESWQAQYSNRVDAEVKNQLVQKCTEAVSSVNTTCQGSIRHLQVELRSRDESISAKEAIIRDLSTRAEVIDLHDNFVRNAEDILKSFQSARERRDRSGDADARARTTALLQSIAKIHQIYADWSGLFNSVVTQLTGRLEKGEQVSVDELAAFLRAYIADADRKRKAAQSEVDFVNKTKGNKF